MAERSRSRGSTSRSPPTKRQCSSTARHIQPQVERHCSPHSTSAVEATAASTGECAAAGAAGARPPVDSHGEEARDEDSVLSVEAEGLDGIRTVKVVYESKDDKTSLGEKLQAAMEDLNLSPYEWQPVGPPVYTDSNGPLQRGQMKRDQIAFPMIVEVKMMFAGDLSEQDGPDEGAEDEGEDVDSDDPDLGSKNPFDSGIYTSPMMSEDELRSYTVPFAKVSEQLRGVLEEFGIAIVSDVIPEEELVSLEAEFAQDLRDLVDEDALNEAGPDAADVREAYAEFRAKGPRAFPVKDVFRFSAAAGFAVKKCISHGRFAWNVRRHPRVRAVYEAIYPEAGKLVSSMDVTFFTPEGQPAKKWNRFSAHVDQNMNDVREGLADWESYQGVLYAWPAAADGSSSTTVVWPGSHRTVWRDMMKDKMFTITGAEGFHYSEIKEMQDADLARKLAEGWVQHARRAVVPRGGLFLWNSRTVHTGWRGGPRLAQTVCFEPADRRSEAERIAKMRLAALGLPSTHWASAGMQHDIVLGDAGYAAVQADSAGWDPSRSKGLPLRQAIRPTGLVESADIQALAGLVRVPYRLTGMWDPPEDAESLLDASVKDEIKSLL